MTKMRHVLIVEDEPAILRIVAIVVRSLGLEPLTVQDAESAEALLQATAPEMVIADVRLPGKDGVELTRRIKSDSNLRKTPVLLMSAYGEPPKHGADRFLAKPFDIDQLEAAVNESIDSR